MVAVVTVLVIVMGLIVVVVMVIVVIVGVVPIAAAVVIVEVIVIAGLVAVIWVVVSTILERTPNGQHHQHHLGFGSHFCAFESARVLLARHSLHRYSPTSVDEYGIPQGHNQVTAP